MNRISAEIFLQIHIRRPQPRQLLFLLERLNQMLQQIQLQLHHPVANQKFVASRKLLQLGQEPFDEIVCVSQDIFLSWHAQPAKNFPQGFALPALSASQFEKSNRKKYTAQIRSWHNETR
jgi:hypothetical protein